MVALPKTTSPTIEAIDRRWAGNQDRQHYPFLRGSQMGHACERALWYKFRWAHPPEEFEGRLLRLFETGHREEARMIEELRAVGIDVQDVDPTTAEQWAVSAVDGHFSGHADGILTGVLEAPKTPHLFEAKTHNAKSFDQLLKHGVEAAKPEHVAQMQVYMHLLGLSRAFYMAKNKNDDALYVERLHYDPAQGAALIAKAERIRAASVPPARVSDDPGYYLCQAFRCPAYDLCHGGDFALRNCRTCLHSTPADGGKWHCSRHDRELSREDQERGCPNHLFLPGLVSGEQIDADPGAETVTYRMPNGADWIDGGERLATDGGAS